MPKYYDTLPDSLASRGDFPEPGTYRGWEALNPAHPLTVKYRTGKLPKNVTRKSEYEGWRSVGFLVVPFSTAYDRGGSSRLYDDWLLAATEEEAHFLGWARMYTRSSNWAAFRTPNSKHSSIYPVIWETWFDESERGDWDTIEIFADDLRSVSWGNGSDLPYTHKLNQAARDGSLRKFLEHRAN